MAKKHQPEEERKPDLAAPDQEVVEQRVKEMLDLDNEPSVPSQPEKVQDDNPPKSSQPKTIEVQEVGSAPELPSDALSTSSVPADKPATDPDEEIEEPIKVVNLDEAPKDAAIISMDENGVPPLADEQQETEDITPTDPEERPLDAVDTEHLESPIEEVLEDQKTAEAVDEIVASEADQVLEAEDEKIAEAFSKEPAKGKNRIANFFRAWWGNPKARWGTILFLSLAIATIFIVPTSRYLALNTLGFRSNASIKILDESTNQPLRNVEVTLSNVTAKTDANGQAKLSRVRLGNNTLLVKKRAFADVSQPVMVKMGKNQFADTRLKPTGVQYSFVLSDFLSGKPISKVEAVSGEASAFSDEQGKIKLTVDGSQNKDAIDVSFKKEDYREDKVTVNADDKSQQAVTLTASRRHMYVSKRTGKYDVYSVDVDGKNEKQLFAGTGSERDDIALLTHSSSNVAALVSTRGEKNKDGFLLSSLTLIDDQASEHKEVVTSERIQLIDWVGDNIVYVQAVSGASATNPKRHRLVSYNYKSKQDKEIAASNYFNDVLVSDNKIYYAPSSTSQPEAAKLYRVNADGSGRSTVLNQEVWSLFRADYDNLLISANQKWFNIRIGEDKATSVSTQPTNPVSRIYADSKDGKNSLWVDIRDGKGTLLNYEKSSRNELVLKAQAGLKAPFYWLNNKMVIYRVSNEQEIADYVLNLDGGEAKKISDVSDTNSLDKWYFY